jgi:hypothetical protein
MTDDERAWRRLIAQTTDPDERNFYRRLHATVPSVTVEWRLEDGEEHVYFKGIALKQPR